MAVANLLFFAFDGQRLLQVVPVGEAARLEDAISATGVSGCAVKGPELHQRLVEQLRMLRVEQSVGLFEKKCPCCRGGGVLLKTKNPGQHTKNISVNYSHGLFECERSDRSRRVGANSRERLQRFEVAGKLSTMFFYHCPGTSVQVSGTAIVTQALPKAQHCTNRRGRKAMNIGECFQETKVIRQSLRYPGLL